MALLWGDLPLTRDPMKGSSCEGSPTPTATPRLSKAVPTASENLHGTDIDRICNGH